jgi:hypothetical protein
MSDGISKGLFFLVLSLYPQGQIIMRMSGLVKTRARFSPDQVLATTHNYDSGAPLPQSLFRTFLIAASISFANMGFITKALIPITLALC